MRGNGECRRTGPVGWDRGDIFGLRGHNRGARIMRSRVKRGCRRRLRRLLKADLGRELSP